MARIQQLRQREATRCGRVSLVTPPLPTACGSATRSAVPGCQRRSRRRRC